MRIKCVDQKLGLIDNEIMLRVAADIRGISINLKKKFKKDATFGEIADVILKRLPMSGNEEYCLYMETMKDRLVLDSSKTLREYEPLFLGSMPSFYLIKRDAVWSPTTWTSELVPEMALVVLLTHTRFMPSIELLQTLFKKL